MIYKKITLRRGKEESLKRFHPWVFSGAIATADDTIEEGDIVSVFAADGTHIGNGHYQVGSIMVRILAYSCAPTTTPIVSFTVRAISCRDW